MQAYSVIAATGSYIPEIVVGNDSFLEREIYTREGVRDKRAPADIISKLQDITGIRERRYAPREMVTSDLATLAAKDALSSWKGDPETLEYLIVANNFGDVKPGNRRCDFVPTVAARVKHRLGIRNRGCAAYDLPFGCPGWVQAAMQADCYIRLGLAQNVLVVGAEVLSRMCDPHDQDSAIFADGAGAAVFSAVKSDEPVGVLAHAAVSDTYREYRMLWLGPSNNPDYDENELFIKMDGHNVFRYALKTLPQVVYEALGRAGVQKDQVAKVLLHQANERLDRSAMSRMYRDSDTLEKMPMTISWLGNSSTATIPTMLDLILKGRLAGHTLKKGDIAVFASVGAGMNTNAMVYRFT